MQERNMLFGLLAVQKKKIPLEDLASVAEQTIQSQQDLGSLLVAAGTISEEDRRALDSDVDFTVQKHGGEGPALKAMEADEAALRTLSSSLYGDPSHAETLRGVPLDERSQMGTVVTAPDIERSQMETMNSAATADRSAMETMGAAAPGERSSMATIATDAMTDAFATRPMQGSLGDAITLHGLHGKPGSRPRSEMAVPAVCEHDGRYKFVKPLMQGGMGKIEIVHDNHLGRDIAFKTLLPDRVPGGTMTRTRGGAPTMELLTVPIIARFLQEAYVTGQLEHPNIIPIYELGYRPDGTLYYTMRFLKGNSLQDKLKECKSLQDRLLLLTNFLDVCQGIAYAHSRNVIHRDLKPMNVMTGEFGETIVIDWGIAKVKGELDINEGDLRQAVKTMKVGDTVATAQTMYGQTMGSPYYMPPEQAAGKTDEINEAADIYALGAILYVILCGQPPYHGMNVREFLVKVQDFPPKPVLEVEPNAPKELAAIVSKAMQRKREDRYQSAGEIADEIQRYLSGGLISAYQYSAAELFKRWYKRNKRVVNTVLAALVLLVAGGIYSYFAILAQRNEAIRQEQIAKEQEAIAVEQRGIAETKEKEAREELYFANVNLAQNSMVDRLPGKALAQLAEAPEEFHNWEWGFVQQEANADRMTIDATLQNVGYGDGVIVTGAGFGKVQVFDAATGVLKHVLLEDAGPSYGFDFSSASGRVTVLGNTGAYVWDASTGAEVYRFTEEIKPAEMARLGARHVAISADGKRLAMLNADKTLRVVDVDTKTEVFTAAYEQFRGAMLELSDDGSRLLMAQAVMTEDGGFAQQVSLVDLSTGASLGDSSYTDPNLVHAASLSPNGSHFAVGIDNAFQVWATAPFQLLNELEGARIKVPRTIGFSPDGAYVAMGTDDGDVGVWNVESGESSFLPKTHADQVRRVVFRGDGAYFCTASGDRAVRLWEILLGDKPGLRLAHSFLGHDAWVYDFAFSPDSTGLVSGGPDENLKVWDLRAEASFHKLGALAFEPRNAVLAGGLGNEVGLWDARTDFRLATLSGHTAPVRKIAFSATGGELASLAVVESMDTDELKVWKYPDGTLQASLQVPKKAQQFIVEPGGAHVLLRAAGKLQRITTADGAVAQEYPINSPVVLNPAGDRAAFLVVPEKGTYQVQLLDLSTGTASVSHTIQSVRVEADPPVLAFDAQGQWLAVDVWTKPTPETNSVAIHLVPLGGGEASVVETGHKNRIFDLAFSPDGSMIATGAGDKTAEIYTVATKSLKVALQKGHGDNIKSVAFSKDGKRLVTASWDGTFVLWDTDAGRQVMTVHSDVIRAEGQGILPELAQFSDDGTVLATFTNPPVAPYVLKAFPWDMSAYPAGDDINARVEAYKRAAAKP